MDINERKVQIAQQILSIREPDVIREIDRFLNSLDYEWDDRFYERKRFYDDGKPKDKKEEKPGLINEARRKIKGKLGFMK